MLIRVDQSSQTPLFEQVAASVRSGAATGRIRPGDRLPSVREVAAALDINLHTALRAYQDLRDEGLVTMRRGRGAVLTDAAGQLVQIHRDVLDLVQRARALGLSPDTLASIVKEISDDR